MNDMPTRIQAKVPKIIRARKTGALATRSSIGRPAVSAAIPAAGSSAIADLHDPSGRGWLIWEPARDVAAHIACRLEERWPSRARPRRSVFPQQPDQPAL